MLIVASCYKKKDWLAPELGNLSWLDLMGTLSTGVFLVELGAEGSRYLALYAIKLNCVYNTTYDMCILIVYLRLEE